MAILTRLLKTKKLILAAIISVGAGILPGTASATIINYTIAPQYMVTWSNQVAGTSWGSFTADFDDDWSGGSITAIDFYIDIIGDKTYTFNTPQTFGSFAMPPSGSTHYEANLATNTSGDWASTFFMDFLPNNTTQLFKGNPAPGGVFTSFGTGSFILGDPVPSMPVPEPTIMLMMVLAIWTMAKKVPPDNVLQFVPWANSAQVKVRRKGA